MNSIFLVSDSNNLEVLNRTYLWYCLLKIVQLLLNMYTKFLTTTLLAAILSMLVATTTMTTPIGAQEGNEFSANLSGEDEVPPTESSANGTAKFQVNDDDTQLSI